MLADAAVRLFEARMALAFTVWTRGAMSRGIDKLLLGGGVLFRAAACLLWGASGSRQALEAL